MCEGFKPFYSVNRLYNYTFALHIGGVINYA